MLERAEVRSGAVATEQEAASEVRTKAARAKQAARKLAVLSAQAKNEALSALADALVEREEEILRANAEDLAAAEARGIGSALLDRLKLTPDRVRKMAQGVREVVELPDPVGTVVRAWRRPNGLDIAQVRVPLGVVGIIYEARPNVTVDASALCLKAGNAVLLRGGSEAIRSNKAIVAIVQEALRRAGLPEGSVELIEDTDRAAAREMMRLNGLIDVLIPRGGAGLIQTVVQNATVPVIETGVGNCHVYVDKDADLEKAVAIVMNSKVARCSVCNAMETLLVHEAVAGAFLPRIAQEFAKAGVEIRGCERTLDLVPGAVPATEEDWSTEYLDLVAAVRVVKGLDEAIEHIERYGTHHSDAIVTENYSAARRFVNEVDSAAVYVNASTYFTDGGQFGFGAEIGISTQKLHARGPMGLPELTSTKYVVHGNGQIRI